MLQILEKMVMFRLALHGEGEMQATDILIYPHQVKDNLPVVTIILLITRFSYSQQS